MRRKVSSGKELVGAVSKSSKKQSSGNSRARFVSPLRYPGGKQKAVKQIFDLVPLSCSEYREPMVGGGSIFLYARSLDMAESYWINDQFNELVAFWKSNQDPEINARLMKELEELRKSFDNADQIKRYFLAKRAERIDDQYKQAFLFFFFNRVTFSGTTRAGGFSSQASQSRFTKSSIEKLKCLPEALKQTVVTQGDFEPVIKKPGKDVFIFLDPPYYNAKKLYGKNGALHAFDHERLSDCLKDSGHKFLMTYDDSKEIRDLYKWANISEWTLQYGMNNCSKNHTSKVGDEIFIRNY